MKYAGINYNISLISYVIGGDFDGGLGNGVGGGLGGVVMMYWVRSGGLGDGLGGGLV